jgi:heme exporter protein C
MPRIMSGLHPGSADDTNAGPIVSFNMNFNMWLISFLSLIGFTILYFWMWQIGYKSLMYKEKIQKQSIRG